jgi:transformation/transcription domain-associated protein
VNAQLAKGSASHKLLEVMLAIADMKISEADRLCAQAAQMALLNWQMLAPISGGSRPHRELFHLFHRLIELRESAGIIGETSKAFRENSLPDLKGRLLTWRDRLPDSWDGLQSWDSLLQWRVHIFQNIQSSFLSSQSTGNNDLSQMASLNDSPWTVITLARAARKHRQFDVGLASLSRLHNVSTMEIVDAYHKLREQILACLAVPSELRGGLNIINSTNLEYFNSEQRADLFRLKGLFQERLGMLNEAHFSYSKVNIFMN